MLQRFFDAFRLASDAGTSWSGCGVGCLLLWIRLLQLTQGRDRFTGRMVKYFLWGVYYGSCGVHL